MPSIAIAIAASAASSAAVAAAGVAATSIEGAIIGAAAFGATTFVGSRIMGGNSNVPSSPIAPAPSQSLAQQARGLLVNSAGTIDPIPVVYGKRRVGGTKLFVEATGSKNEYLTLVICHCEGEVEAIDMVYLDGIAYNDAKFAGLVQLETHTGTDGQAASSLAMANSNGKWTSDHKVSGCAYSVLVLKYDANVFGSVPVVTADIRGKKVYDPRTGTTGYSTNPALCIRDYLTNARYGRGIPDAQIDDAAIDTAANYCDAAVTLPDGSTQPRYSCNGIVNIDANTTENMTAMLAGCRGWLIFTGGLYRLVLDTAGTISFTFDEDNICGAWSIKNGDKRTMFNQVKGNYFSEANNWQPDIATVDDTVSRAADNGLLLSTQLTLSFTSNTYEAQILAQRHLKQSRFGIMASFNATIAGTLCEVGDIVGINHTTPGWTAKPFRVLDIELLSNDEVRVTLQEYDDSVYALDPLTAPRVSAATNLPDPSTVQQPGTPICAESLYVTRDGAGVKSMLSLSCFASDDAFVVGYQFQYKPTTATSWIDLGIVDAPAADILDIAPGTYDLRVRAINSLGINSDWSSSSCEALGLLAVPADMAGLTLQPVSSLALLQWTQSTDLDVKIGGKIIIRHSPTTSGATWEGSVKLAEKPGSDTVAVLPLLTGTYMIKAQDSSGQFSVNAALVVSDGANPFTWTSLASIQEDPLFPGTFDSTYHDTDVGNTVELVGAGLFDDIADFDAISNLDYYGGIVSGGYYYFNAGIDLGSVKNARITTTLRAGAENVLDLIDDRTALLDTWLNFDGTAGAPVDAWIEVRTTPDDPAASPVWGAWQRVTVADFYARAFEFRARLESSDPAYNVPVDQLRAMAQTL